MRQSAGTYSEPDKQSPQLFSRKMQSTFQCPDDLVSGIQSSLNGKADPIIMPAAVGSLEGIALFYA